MGTKPTDDSLPGVLAFPQSARSVEESQPVGRPDNRDKRASQPCRERKSAIAASQDGKRVLYLQVGSTDADIMLLDHFR